MVARFYLEFQRRGAEPEKLADKVSGEVILFTESAKYTADQVFWSLCPPDVVAAKFVVFDQKPFNKVY